MSGGYSFESFAATLKCNRDTLYEWAKVHPSFSDAKKAGTDQAIRWYEEQAVKGMWNSKDGPNLNTTLWIFIMKCRFGYIAPEVQVLQQNQKATQEQIGLLTEFIKQEKDE